MPRAEFTIRVPTGVWVGDISRANPDAVLRVLSTFPLDERGYALVEVVGGDPDELLDAMERSPAVVTLDVLQSTDDRAVVQFETTDLPLLVTIQRAQIPVELPLKIRDGTVRLVVTTTHDRISRFGDQLSALNIDYQLDRIYSRVEGKTPLTDHQRDLLLAALDRGYYDTPREMTLTKLADELEIPPSTVSETLHRAEERVVKTFANDYLGRENAERHRG